MHEYRSPALKRFNCLLSETDAAYHEAALRQGLNDSSSRTRGAFCTFSGRLPDLSLRGSAGAVAISQDWLEHRKAPADS